MALPVEEAARRLIGADAADTQSAPLSVPATWSQPQGGPSLSLEWRAAALRLDAAVQDAAKRAADVLVAALALAATLPLSVLIVAGHWLRLEGALDRAAVLGRHQHPFDLLSFRRLPGAPGRWMARWGAARIPALVNVLRGELSLVGPRPQRVQEADLRIPLVRRRLDVQPGLTCLWWIRRRGNTAYEAELEADREYVESHSLAGDLKIVLGSWVVALYGAPAEVHADTVNVLGIAVRNVSLEEAVGEILARLDRPDPSHVAFLNAHNANVAHEDPWYHQALTASDLVLADGIGVKLAGHLLGQPIKQNVNGTDLFPRLCQALEGSGRRVFLLGAEEGVAEGVAAWIAARFPGVEVCGHHHGQRPSAEDGEVAARVAASRPDLLLVAMGTPRQETWIRDRLAETGARVAIGVGGLFDFYSGRVPRAPRLLRDLGLEWVYRLLQEPGRLWRRYVIGNPLFLARVLLQGLGARLGRSSTVQRGR